MDEVRIFYRDINLKPSICELYSEGLLLKEGGFVDMSLQRGGPFTTHRYVIISNRYVCNKPMEDSDENWLMYTIGRNELFRIKKIITIKKVTYYILAHINGDNQYDEDLYTKLAIKQIKEDSKQKPNFEVATFSWLERCMYPLGITDNGSLFLKKL